LSRVVFDPTVSDLDFIAILATDPSDEQAADLESMHRRLDQENPDWAGRLEVVYVSAACLREHRQGIPRMAVISPGEPFHVLSGGPDWVLTWYPFREESVALVGPAIHEMIPLIPRDDFLAAVREQLRRVPAWIKGDSTRGANAYVILATCRGLYTIRLGVRPSTVEAAKWATGEFPQWASLIESALTWRKEQWTNPGTDEASVTATRRFVTEVAAQ
jgi:aminoglycoside adenylyltransferase-like protein